MCVNDLEEKNTQQEFSPDVRCPGVDSDQLLLRTVKTALNLLFVTRKYARILH